MSEQIYIFNPEHDMCIANGDENFVPPRSAVGFAKENMELSEYLKRPNKQSREIIPWGWNHSLKKRLINEGIDPATLPSEEELQFIRTHSRREFALNVHSRLSYEDSLVIGPDYRIVATSVSEIEAFLSANEGAVLKSPLSGSGKGIRFVRKGLSESDKGWCRRTLDKQGSVIIERRFEIIKECAMLFECHHEGIDFIGYSLFESKNGAYNRNILASNKEIEDIITEYIPRETLSVIRENLTSILTDTLVGHYEGFLGVDQIICQTVSPVFIPVSEINLRMTMGLIARNQYDHCKLTKMKKLIFIDACMRAGSRTKQIAGPIIAELGKRYSVETVDLTKNIYPIVDSYTLEDRNQGFVPSEHVETARKVASADRIVIAAPFWDMSFPSALKVFFENISLFGITFDSNGKECYGLCKAKKVMYITTRGMNISTGDPLEQATPYIKALSHLWGWGELTVVAAQNMDYSSAEEIEAKIKTAVVEGIDICKEF